MTASLPTSSQYLLQPGLAGLHQQTLAWESDLRLWREEFAFFEKLITKYRKELHLRNELAELDHLRFLLNYYSLELADALAAGVTCHESRLRTLMEPQTRQDESAYRSEHEALSLRILAFEQEFICFKNDLYDLLEKGLVRSKRRTEDTISAMNRTRESK